MSTDSLFSYDPVLTIVLSDCALDNIMMDARALYVEPWHPQRPVVDMRGRINLDTWIPRTAVGGVQYYFIDFGLSTFREDQAVGYFGHICAPELSPWVPYDPYKVDVYILGKTFDEFLVEVSP